VTIGGKYLVTILGSVAGGGGGVTTTAMRMHYRLHPLTV